MLDILRWPYIDWHNIYSFRVSGCMNRYSDTFLSYRAIIPKEYKQVHNIMDNVSHLLMQYHNLSLHIKDFWVEKTLFLDSIALVNIRYNWEWECWKANKTLASMYFVTSHNFCHFYTSQKLFVLFFVRTYSNLL